ncbi:MAG TPA: type I methionyl aminopeptidase [bacterium]|nr:type I methionyl aminopeptidase [bacterium]
MAIIYKTPEEIELMSISGQILADTFKYIKRFIKAGISTYEIDKIIEEYILSRNAIPAFKGYNGFPAASCISVNEVVVHGIPSKEKILKNGDIVSIDIGVIKNNYCADAAFTYEIGQISKKAKKLVDITKEALKKGIEQIYPGNRLSNISYAIQSYAEKNNFSVVRQFVGHGIGQKMHESPQVPNFGKKNNGIILKPGLVLAIEPMINEGVAEVVILSDGWTAVTRDKKLSAHFEHTVAVTENGALILTEF